MPKTRQQNQRKRQQRALQKRTRRNVKRTRRATQEAAAERPASVLRRAREFPFAGFWVQPDWQEHRTASLVVARTQPTDEIVFARFLVDTLCLGLRQSFYSVGIERDRFDSDILPRLYPGQPPSRLDVEVAHEIVFGAIEFAEGIGLPPHKSFSQSQQVLDPPDAHPRTGAIEFGYEGRPVYIPRGDGNERAVLDRLIQTVGKGNFTYLPVGDPPEGYEELVTELDEEDEESPLWTPRQEAPTGRLDDESGLWTPGQPEEVASDDEESSRSSLWVPGA